MTHSVVVDDLGDNGNVTSGRSVVNKDDSADFDESLEGGWLLGLDVSCVSGMDVLIEQLGRAAVPSSIFPSSMIPFKLSMSVYSSSYPLMLSLYHHPSLSVHDVPCSCSHVSLSRYHPFSHSMSIQESSCSAILHLQLMLDLQPLLLSNYPINGEE
jgi:hypothetical protein